MKPGPFTWSLAFLQSQGTRFGLLVLPLGRSKGASDGFHRHRGVILICCALRTVSERSAFCPRSMQTHDTTFCKSDQCLLAEKKTTKKDPLLWFYCLKDNKITQMTTCKIIYI